MCVPLIFADDAEFFEHSPQTAKHTVDLHQDDQECMSTFNFDGRFQIQCTRIELCTWPKFI